MTTWNELPAHLVSKIRSDSVTAPANLPGAVPVLKYGNRVTEVDGIRFDSEKEADYYWRHSSRAYCWPDLMSMVAWPPQKTAASNLKPPGRSGNAIYYTFPAKDTFVSSKKITARRSPCRAATA